MFASSMRKVAGATVLTTGGAAMMVYHKSDDDNREGAASLIVPTLQATARVARLVHTCAWMVVDYKFPTGLLMSSNHQHAPPANINNSTNNTEELEYWEHELELRQQALDDAQERYTNAKDLPHITDITERIQAKQQQKLDMKHCAQLLAEAEQHLQDLGLVAGTTRKSQIHTKCAQRLLDLCHVNRGVYIKVGQHIATLDYLIPPEYIQVLSQLYDDNPTTSYENVCRVIQQDLGQSPEELFDTFDPTPIASASLAQVHVATKHGQKLAVKVQHYGLRETSQGDLFSLCSMVRLAEWMFPKDFPFGWLADEIAPNLPKELDFTNEAKNAERAQRHIQQTNDLKDRVVVPNILWPHTSERVLTMEFEEGIKTNNVEGLRKMGLDPHRIAHLISSLFASQVFESGHVHCDPHEGNLLIRKAPKGNDPVLVLVDHGLYKQLDDDFRRQYAQLWKSIMLADLDGIQQACESMGIPGDDTFRLFAGILTARPFDEIVERSQSKDSPAKELLKRRQTRSDQAIIRGYAQRYLPNIIAMLSIIPRDMILLLKMNDCLRHIDFMLGHPTNTILVTGRMASRAIYRYEMDQLRNKDRSEGGLQQQRQQLSSISSLWYRMRTWWRYMSVQWRIQLSETGLWFLQRVGWIRLM